MDFKVLHEDGEWITCAAPLGVRNPFTGDLFVQGVKYKVELDVFGTCQMAAGVFVSCEDPVDAKAAQAKIEAKHLADLEAAEAAAQAAVDKQAKAKK